MSIKEFFPAIKYGNLVSGDEIVSSAALTTPNIGAATGTSLTTTGTLTGNNAGANTAAGNTTPALTMGSSGIGIYFGDGAPTISAVKGSLYLNFTGSSTSTRLYVNNGTTTWVAVTTAS